MPDSLNADAMPAPLLTVPDALASEAAAVLLGGDAGALKAVQEKMAAALTGQGLPGSAASALADGWMHNFTNEIGASASPDAAILQANRIAADTAARMAQAAQDAASMTGEQRMVAALAQGQDIRPEILHAPGAASDLSAALFNGVMDPLARPAGAADPTAALSNALSAPTTAAGGLDASPLSPADKLTAALASGVGVQDAVKALGPDQAGHFAEALEQALSSGTDAATAVSTAKALSDQGHMQSQTVSVEQSDGGRMLSALASGSMAAAPGAAGGTHSDAAFASVLNDALARGASPDAALGASAKAQTAMAASQDAAVVPPKPTDALVASLASGRNVTETVKTFAAAAGIDGAAAGGFGQALGSALSTGQEPAGALGTARQDVSIAAALSTESAKGVKGDGLVAALASGQNVQQAVQAVGGAGPAFSAALGRALADGRSPGQALAAAHHAADIVQQNAQATAVPVSAENKALADLANPNTAAESAKGDDKGHETAGEKGGEKAEQQPAQNADNADGKATEQVADADAKGGDKEGGKDDGKEGAKDDAKGDAKGDAGDKAAADASHDAAPAASDGAPAAKSAGMAAPALKAISFGPPDGSHDAGDKSADTSAHSTTDTDLRPASSAPSVTTSLSSDPFAVAAQSQQRVAQTLANAVENATSTGGDSATPGTSPTLPATTTPATPTVPTVPTVPVDHHTTAPALSATFDAAAFAKAMALAEGTAAPAGFTVFHLIEAMFRPGEAGSSVIGVAVVANQGSALGVWQYSVDGSTWLEVGSVGETSALVLPGSALLRFLPAAGAYGKAPALELRAVGDEWTAGFSGAEHRLFTLTGTGGTTPLSADAAQLSVDITPVNGAPVATATHATLSPAAEDSTNPDGASVSSLFGGLFSDPTDAVFGQPGDKFAGVAVVANPENADQGQWQYWNGSSWVAIGAASDGNALLLAADAKLRFLPTADWNGKTPSLAVRLVDDSKGSITSGSHVDLTSAGVGGTTPYSDSTIVLDSRVTPVNDAPIATGTAVTLPVTAEDSTDPAAATVSSLFGSLFSDPADAVSGGSASNLLAGVLVVGNAAAATQGMWQYWTGSAWADIGAAGDGNGVLLAAGTKLRFLPAADWNGTTPALTVRLVDDSDGAITSGDRVSSTAGGGTSRFSAGTITLTGAVGAVNDAPVATATTASLPAIAEDTADPAGATVTSLFGSLFSDAADAVAGGSTANAFAGIAVVGNAATAAQGVWQYWTGTTWADVGAASEGSALVVAAADKLRFVPAADWNGTTPALTVRLIEDGGGAIATGGHVDLTHGVGGSTVYSAETIALTGSVTPVNDAPEVTAGTPSLTVAEGMAVAITGLSVSDIDAGSTPLLVTLTAGHGTLTLADTGMDAVITGNGTDSVTIRATLATINSLLGATNGLLYTAGSSAGSDTIQVLVDDQGGGGAGGALTATASVGITVAPPNASPVLTDTNLEFSVAAEALAEPAAGTAGIAVSKLVGLNGSGPANVTDSDAGAVTGIALVGANESYGHWWYSTDDGATWQLVGTVNDSDSALLLRSTDRLYFQPNASVPADVHDALTIRAWDQTTGTYGTKVAVDATDGSAFSGTTDSVTLHPGVLVPNGSFENDLVGWKPSGGTTVEEISGGHEVAITSASGKTPIEMEDLLGLTHGTIAEDTGITPFAGHVMTLASTVTVTEDTYLSFDWSFTFTDGGSYEDFAFVSINGKVTLLAAGTDGNGTFPGQLISAGSTLSLGFGVADTGDNQVSPILRVDNIKLTTVASDPIVLDMTGDGLSLRPLSDGVHFDVTGDGVADQTGWVGVGNALLVRDENHNGLIDDARELVSERFGSGYNSSLEALASLDGNHDGRLDATDEAFATLKVWQDVNGDGVSQANELRGLAAAGISSIATTATASDATLAGSRILGTTSMVMSDSSTHAVAGVAFDVKAASAAQVNIQPQATPSGTTAGTAAGTGLAGTNFTALLSSGLGLPDNATVAQPDANAHAVDAGSVLYSHDTHHPLNSDPSSLHPAGHA